ncbi:hypothetical protein WN55_07206 [Dufourea novaeangliae]|uniref:Uncharacterized protein n=1 Tax=Dufourea novaeangliae TaxID=178035 RepID=A0A154PRR6_DUFNO|nr:hypothetical protein WN55_07206 [Dufourea novaeangliae]
MIIADSCMGSNETGFAPVSNNSCTISLDALDLTANSKHVWNKNYTLVIEFSLW